MLHLCIRIMSQLLDHFHTVYSTLWNDQPGNDGQQEGTVKWWPHRWPCTLCRHVPHFAPMHMTLVFMCCPPIRNGGQWWRGAGHWWRRAGHRPLPPPHLPLYIDCCLLIKSFMQCGTRMNTTTRCCSRSISYYSTIIIIIDSRRSAPACPLLKFIHLHEKIEIIVMHKSLLFLKALKSPERAQIFSKKPPSMIFHVTYGWFWPILFVSYQNSLAHMKHIL